MFSASSTNLDVMLALCLDPSSHAKKPHHQQSSDHPVYFHPSTH